MKIIAPGWISHPETKSYHSEKLLVISNPLYHTQIYDSVLEMFLPILPPEFDVRVN